MIYKVGVLIFFFMSKMVLLRIIRLHEEKLWRFLIPIINIQLSVEPREEA